MGYFPNATAWDCWAPDNCFKCSHWPKGDEGPPCPVESAHMLFNYDQAEGTPIGITLDLLIPRTKDGLGNKRCAMFKDKDGLSPRHLRDWEKYKALMAERDAAIADTHPQGEDPLGASFMGGGGAVRQSPETPNPLTTEDTPT